MDSRINELICSFEEQLNSEHFHSPVDSLKFIKSHDPNNGTLKEYAKTMIQDGVYHDHESYCWYKFLASTIIPVKYI